jgi:hypothetical protein
MENTCVYLIGAPGVGKYTVGRLLAEQMPGRLVDNHYWNNPIFEMLEPDGFTPLPDHVWDLTNAVRVAVLDAIATMAPPQRNFIFTHAISNDGGHDWDRVIAEQLLSAAERRSAGMLVVRLACSHDELAERIQSPERAMRLKQRDASKAEAYCRMTPFDPGHQWTVDIDTTGATAVETADRVIQILGDR